MLCSDWKGKVSIKIEARDATSYILSFGPVTCVLLLLTTFKMLSVLRKARLKDKEMRILMLLVDCASVLVQLLTAV